MMQVSSPWNSTGYPSSHVLAHLPGYCDLVAGMEEEGQEQTSFKYLPTGTVKELIDQPLFGFHY